MKFRVMLGDDPQDGFIILDDKPPVGNLNLSGTKPEFENIWMVEYDDTITPVRNTLEIKQRPDGSVPERDEFLSEDEIVWWKNWVVTEHDKALAEQEAEAVAQQRVADEELVAEFGVWDFNNRCTRDNILGLSDAYETFDHLKTDEWIAWRQWLRELPTNNPDPLTITFQEPPSNVNSMIKRSWDNWKQRITLTKEVKEKL